MKCAWAEAPKPSPLRPGEVPGPRNMTGYEIIGFAHINDHQLVTLLDPAVQFGRPDHKSQFYGKEFPGLRRIWQQCFRLHIVLLSTGRTNA